MIRVRMSSSDAHYGGNLISGAKILELFGDVATELLIENDGDEGLFAGYKKIDFLAPVYAGDFIEAKGKITGIGNTSRDIEFEAYKVIQARKDISESAADYLEKPILVVKAEGTCVVKKENQRK
ncbi:3-aminobutyryl-CoA ammonia lyase [subsurface metagenome]